VGCPQLVLCGLGCAGLRWPKLPSSGLVCPELALDGVCAGIGLLGLGWVGMCWHQLGYTSTGARLAWAEIG
jgi:hypothetical protein